MKVVVDKRCSCVKKLSDSTTILMPLLSPSKATFDEPDILSLAYFPMLFCGLLSITYLILIVTDCPLSDIIIVSASQCISIFLVICNIGPPLSYRWLLVVDVGPGTACWHMLSGFMIVLQAISLISKGQVKFFFPDWPLCESFNYINMGCWATPLELSGESSNWWGLDRMILRT